MESEKFCLRWNDFESNISSAFRELREDKDFFDITLACENETIQAHKVILSACSPFFRGVLRRYPHQNPLLYLKGVKYTDIHSVLNFMYHGEVNVAQEDLNSFLAVAEDLKVKGLTQNQSQPENPPKVANHTSKKPNLGNIHSEKESTSTKNHARPENYAVENSEVEEIVPVKSEPADHITTQPAMHHQKALATPEENYMAMAYQEEGNYEEYEQYEAVQEYIPTRNMDQPKGETQDMLAEAVSEDGKTAWRCLVCGKDFLIKSNGKRHVQTMHFEAPNYECEVCGKVLKNKNSYQNHISVTHGIKKRSVNKNIF